VRRTPSDLPRVAWKADDSDRAAGKANKDVEVLEDDAQQPQDGAGSGVRRLGGAVAALNRAGAARRSRGGSGGGSTSATSGDSNGSRGESQSGKELELHVEDWVVRAVVRSNVLL
jgi:hypothetical protein